MQEFVTKWEGKRFEELRGYWFECVALAKLAAKELYWYAFTPYGGTADTGRQNKSWTFNLDEWIKVEAGWHQLPRPGDIIFWNKKFTAWTWHVAVVAEVYKWEDRITVLEQNGVGSSTWFGADAIRLKDYTYKNLSGWYSYIKSSPAQLQAIEDYEKAAGILWNITNDEEMKERLNLAADQARFIK